MLKIGTKSVKVPRGMKSVWDEICHSRFKVKMCKNEKSFILLFIIIINRASWICHWGIIPRYYNLGLARQSTHKQINIQVQGLFSV